MTVEKKWSFVFRIAVVSFFWPALLSAQNAPDVIPQNQSSTDTAHQVDIVDVYKKWFKLPPCNLKIPHPENKVYFTLNPLANAPTSSGNAFVTSTTANWYTWARNPRPIFPPPILLPILTLTDDLVFR